MTIHTRKNLVVRLLSQTRLCEMCHALIMKKEERKMQGFRNKTFPRDDLKKREREKRKIYG